MAEDQAVIDDTDAVGAASEQGPPEAGPEAARAEAAEEAAEENGAGAMLSAIGIAESLFHRAASDLTRLSDRIELGEMVEAKEAVAQARALRAATQTMMDERNRVDKLRKEVGGGCGGAGSLDLDAARDEIGRRLACLRRASGG